MRLGINIDHVATIRNARGSIHPDPLKAAKIAENPLKRSIPAMQTADAGGGGGAVAIGGTTNVSNGSTTMIQGSSSEDKHSNLLKTG